MLYDRTAYGTPNDTGCVTVFDRMTATTNAVLIYRIRKVTYKHSLKLPVYFVLNFFIFFKLVFMNNTDVYFL
jgi:hypothetical protein